MKDLKNRRNKASFKGGRYRLSALIPYALYLIPLIAVSQAAAYDFQAGNKKDSYIDVTVNNIYTSEANRASSRNGQELVIDMTFDLSHVNLKSNAELVVTPMIVDDRNHAVALESFTIAGRNRYYWLIRNGQDYDLTLFRGWGKYRGTLVGLASSYNNEGVNPSRDRYPRNTDTSYSLSYSTPFQPWMSNARIILRTQDIGCANCGKGEYDYALAQTRFQQLQYAPAEFIYVTPVAEVVKMREISARAFIDFPVNRTEIYPDYRRNPQELAKIRATIDSVRNDRDIKVTSLHISGTASPEGAYNNNVRLAKGRTEALKDYVQLFYRFPAGFITTSYEPVDWAGLKDFLQGVLNLRYGNSSTSQQQNNFNNQITQQPNYTANSNNPAVAGASGQYTVGKNQFGTFIDPSAQPVMQQQAPAAQQADNGFVSSFPQYLLQEGLYQVPHAYEILQIVNSGIEPQRRNSNIRDNYPKEYQWLLQNVYPALRHSDYRIAFEIKTYSDVNEIVEVMLTQPSKLSLSEFFAAASAQPEGSDLYNRAFETAVQIYPNDETANLNAGIAAMKRGDYLVAQRYLDKAGSTPEARYARAVLAFEQADYDTAKELLRNLVDSTSPAVSTAAMTMLQDMQRVDAANGFTWAPL